MTNFVKEKFEVSGHYLSYEGKFVGRFKHDTAAAISSFRTFLIRHFTVEEYFDRLEKKESPLPIVEDKGYLLPHIRRWLRKGTLGVYRGKDLAAWDALAKTTKL
jgi:hypothetical protein